MTQTNVKESHFSDRCHIFGPWRGSMIALHSVFNQILLSNDRFAKFMTKAATSASNLTCIPTIACSISMNSITASIYRSPNPILINMANDWRFTLNNKTSVAIPNQNCLKLSSANWRAYTANYSWKAACCFYFIKPRKTVWYFRWVVTDAR